MCPMNSNLPREGLPRSLTAIILLYLRFAFRFNRYNWLRAIVIYHTVKSVLNSFQGFTVTPQYLASVISQVLLPSWPIRTERRCLWSRIH